MAEPVALETWLRQEEGFAWILEASQSDGPALRRRAARAVEALDRSLQRILAQGRDRGWIRHRDVRYLLLVERAAEGWHVMTLARSMSWLEDSVGLPEPMSPASHAPTPPPAARRAAGYYNR